MRTVFDLSLEVMRHVTDVLQGTATDGGKHYLTDIRGMKTQPNGYYDNGTLWIRSGTHASKALRVNAHLEQKVTFDPLSSDLAERQVETATVAGSVTGSGNATVVVTAAGMPNSPKTVSVAVLNLDSASTVGGKIRTALQNDADVNEFFEVSGSGTGVILTARVAAANDATMNVSIDNGTCTGLTTAATSANTTAGSAGPRYALTGGMYPFEQIMGAIETALDTTYVIEHDDTLEGDGETREFLLPAGVEEIYEVVLENSVKDSISNHWVMDHGYLKFDYGFDPCDGDVIHIYHKMKHEALTGYDTEISDQINPQWLTLAAAKELLFWGLATYGKKEGQAIEDRLNKVMGAMKGMSARRGSPSLRLKSGGG